MLFGIERLELQLLAFGDGRQTMLQILVFVVFLVLAFLVDLEETLEFRNAAGGAEPILRVILAIRGHVDGGLIEHRRRHLRSDEADRKSTRLNSSHLVISYAVF